MLKALASYARAIALKPEFAQAGTALDHTSLHTVISKILISGTYLKALKY